MKPSRSTRKPVPRWVYIAATAAFICGGICGIGTYQPKPELAPADLDSAHEKDSSQTTQSGPVIASTEV